MIKVALDIHEILMLKNKIYKYLSTEILKNFITILLTFTAIAWVVRAVNFLDLMVEDGHTTSIYFKYSVLNIVSLMTRFVPLAFLLSLTISIIKFGRQQELLILWTTGLSKIRIANIFLLISFFITLFQIILSIFINPFLLNESRSLLRDNKNLQVSSVLKSNDFSDIFQGTTFYIDKKKSNNELQNIFINDSGGNLKLVADNSSDKKNSTIIAKKGFHVDNKIVLFDGVIQTINKKNEMRNVNFEKTEISLNNVMTRTITQPKIQETSTRILLKCVFLQDKNLNLTNCSKGNYKSEVVQTLSRRLGSPFYIPLIAVITSFLLIYKKEKKYNYLKKYVLFTLCFVVLILAEIILKYTGFSFLVASSYFIAPIILTIILYAYLLKKMITEKIINE